MRSAESRWHFMSFAHTGSPGELPRRKERLRQLSFHKSTNVNPVRSPLKNPRSLLFWGGKR